MVLKKIQMFSKGFLECTGHDWTRTVEQSWKKINRLVTLKLFLKKTHVAIFPVLRKMTHMSRGGSSWTLLQRKQHWMVWKEQGPPTLGRREGLLTRQPTLVEKLVVCFCKGKGKIRYFYSSANVEAKWDYMNRKGLVANESFWKTLKKLSLLMFYWSLSWS